MSIVYLLENVQSISFNMWKRHKITVIKPARLRHHLDAMHASQ